MAIGGEGGDIAIFDSNVKDVKYLSNRNMGIPYSHTTPIQSLVELPNHILASSDGSGRVTLWDLETGKHLNVTLPGYTDRVHGMAVLPDGRLITGCVKDTKLRIWNTNGITHNSANGQTITYQEWDLGYDIGRILLLDDGKTLAVSLVNKEGAGHIYLWDTNTKRKVKDLKEKKKDVSAYASYDAGFAMTVLPTGELATTLHSKVIKIWEPSKGNFMRKFSDAENNRGHNTGCLMVTNDGALVRGATDGTIHIWDATYAHVKSYPEHIGGYSGETTIVTLKDGTLVSAAYDEKVCLWRFGQRPLILKDIQSTLNALKTNSSVKSLNLNGIPLGDEGAKNLVDMLQENQSLIALDVRNTNMTDKGIRELLRAIKAHKTLHIIDYTEDAFNPYLSEGERRELQLLFTMRQRALVPLRIATNLFEQGKINYQGKFECLLYKKSIQKWSEKFPMGELQQKVDSAIKQNLASMLQLDIYNPIAFDLAIIRDVFSQKLEEPSFNQFKVYSQRILLDHSAQVSVVQRLVEPQNSAHTFDSFIGQLHQFSTQITHMTTTIDMAKIDGNLEEIVKKIESGKIEQIPIENVTKIVTTVLSQNIAALGLECVPQLGNAIAHAAIELPKIDLQNIDFSKINFNFEALGSLLSICGTSPQLINQVVTVGKATISIAENIGKIIGGAAILGPIGVIGGAITAIFSLFSSGGPSKEERMLSQLSEQINKVAEHIDKRFNNLQQVICESVKNLATHLDRRFDAIQKNLGAIFEQNRETMRLVQQFYQHSMCQFDDLRHQLKELGDRVDTIVTDLKSIQTDTTIIRDTLKDIEREMHQGFVDQSSKDYTNLTTIVESFKKRELKDVERYNEAIKHCDKFVTWATVNSKLPTLSGNKKSNEQLTDSKLCSKIANISIDYSIRLIESYYYVKLKCKANFKSVLGNPFIWAKAAEDYLAFSLFYLRSAHKDHVSDFVKHQLPNIEKLQKTGQELHYFIQTISQDSELFNELINGYRKQVEALLLKPPIDEKSAMHNLEMSYQLLYIFTALAFSHDHYQQGHLHQYLDLQLFDRGQFDFYIPYLKDDFIKNAIAKNLFRSNPMRRCRTLSGNNI